MEVSTELEANEEQNATVSGNDIVTESETEALAEETADLSYTDENGNVFTYVLDEEGNATIIGITVSGATLVIPEVINEALVVAVDNANQCVVTNPGIRIPELTINCHTIGERAFYGTTIGTLTIGADVKAFVVCNDGDYSFDYYYLQFAYAKVDKVVLQAVELVTGLNTGKSTDTFYGPFYRASIGDLEIGSGVTLIPEMFIHGAKITIEELRITQPVVEAYAFCGSNISIGTLVLDSTLESFEESYYSTNLFHHFNQFSYANIGTLKLYTPDLQVNKKYEKSTNCDVFSGFYGATVGSLEIGSEVQVIPEYFLYYATMSMEELGIHTPEIGPCAFGGGKISFGTLTIGREVTTFPESFYSTGIFHYWRQFANCSIGELIYEADAAAVVNDVEAITSASADLDGPFIGASIGTFTLKENVTCIPDYLLRGAKLAMEELELHVPDIGAMAFMSSNISIGKLIISEDVTVFQKSGASNGTYNLWEQFGLVTIGELYFNAPSLTLIREAEYDNICEGPFYQSKIGHLHLGEQVERIPGYCFIGAYLEQEELEIHAKSIGVRAFAGANMVIDTLTIGEEVETFENFPSGNLLFYRQFANNKITTVKYLPVALQTVDDCYKGIFDEATIGYPEFGEAVEVVPNYLFYNAIINLDEYTLDVPTLGCFAFSGNKIVFQKLTIGEDVTTFVADSDSASKAFDRSTINALYYNATEAQTSVLNYSVYGPFSYNTKVKALYVGDNVKVIPHGCFKGTTMNLEELTIENAAIGYDAFNGRNIKIGTLNLGKNVNYVGVVSGGTNNFAWASIGTLNYNSNAVDPDWSASTNGTGMFYFTTIGQLNIGPDVEVIPALWFRAAKIQQDTLTIPCNWSYGSFYSNDIVVGTLILNGDFEAIHYRGNANYGFENITAETVIYDVPAAGITSTDTKTYGPFYGADITNFMLGEHVEFIHSQLLRGNEFTNCYVYPVDAGEGYLEQTFTKTYLPTTEHLYVHYYSDFLAYFDNQVTEYHWLCVDYFDTTYGDKIYDEETGEYVVEIFKTCSVCGYEEQGKEELDNSYNVYLSIPVEIPLTFDAEEEAYTGSEQVYAYGTLGNAYEGLQIVVDREAEGYGKAVMGESSYQISSYLSVGFRDGEAAVFSLEQLEANAACVQAGEAVTYQDEMQVQVDALAFIEGGAGYYQISIPIRMELVH